MTLQRFLAELDPIMWKAGDWAARLPTLLPVTLTNTNSYTLAEQADGAGGIRRGRITHTAGAQGNDRRCYLAREYSRDDRILNVWQRKPFVAAGGAQVGQCHRVRLDPDGRARGYVVRHDYTFAQDALLQAGYWSWDPTTGANSLTIVGDLGVTLTGVQKIIAATDASRTANVVTATGLPVGHGLQVGQTVATDFADNTYDVTTTVTAVGATTAQWAQVAADDASAGAGTLNNLDGVFPLAVESWLVGTDLAVRAWRLTDQSAPSWTDPTRALIFHAAAGADPFPARRGRSGLYIGHLQSAGFAEWGAFLRTRIR